jgi:hypothetical protein
MSPHGGTRGREGREKTLRCEYAIREEPSLPYGRTVAATPSWAVSAGAADRSSEATGRTTQFLIYKFLKMFVSIYQDDQEAIFSSPPTAAVDGGRETLDRMPSPI